MTNDTKREERDQCRQCVENIQPETHCHDCLNCHVCCRCQAGEG